MKPLQGKRGRHLCLQAEAQKHNRLGTNSTSILEHICLSLSNSYMSGSGKQGTRVT